jgi:prephenate dehydrogenase
MERAHSFVTAVGARPIVMDPDAHDRVVALTSHLPHLIAFALALAAADVADGPDGAELPALVSTGFLGATRLAESDPVTTAGFLSANAGPIAEAADRLGSSLDALLGVIGDPSALATLLDDARSARQAMPEAVDEP